MRSRTQALESKAQIERNGVDPLRHRTDASQATERAGCRKGSGKAAAPSGKEETLRLG